MVAMTGNRVQSDSAIHQQPGNDKEDTVCSTRISNFEVMP